VCLQNDCFDADKKGEKVQTKPTNQPTKKQQQQQQQKTQPGQELLVSGQNGEILNNGSKTSLLKTSPLAGIMMPDADSHALDNLAFQDSHLPLSTLRGRYYYYHPHFTGGEVTSQTA